MASPAVADVQPKTVTPLEKAFVDAAEDILFGSIAGAAGKYIEYPFDTVKVRLQSQPDHLPLRYAGPLDCFKQSLRSDGFLGLYRGVSAPLVGAALETSSLFFWERIGRSILFEVGVCQPDKPLPLSALWFTGALSGAFTSLLLTPVELVKCKIQVSTTSYPDSSRRSHTPLSVIKDVFRHQGLRGFWNGQLGTLIRETGGSAAWFGTKETVTLAFRHLNKRSSSANISPAAPVALDNTLGPLPLWQQAIAGASAGMSYNFLFFPADTIKSRMQTSSIHSSAPKTRFWAEGFSIYKQYGIKGLYRGCGITVMRSAPSSAFIFIIFDALKGKFSYSDKLEAMKVNRV